MELEALTLEPELDRKLGEPSYPSEGRKLSKTEEQGSWFRVLSYCSNAAVRHHSQGQLIKGNI